MTNKRYLDIIRLLLKQEDYITITSISELLSVSNKTIRNDLYSVEQWLDENNLKLIKKTGVGVSIEGLKQDKLHVYQLIHEQKKSNIDYSKEARQIFIVIKLITNQNCRVYELADDLFVSRATIHKDILSITPLLEQYKITLLRKNNNGLNIQGSEKNLRKLLIDMLSKDNGYATFSAFVKDPSKECDGSFPFLALDINDDEIQEFLQLLESVNNTYIKHLLFTSLVQVTLHLFGTLIRIQEKHYVTLSSEFIEELRPQPFYDDVCELVNALENHYQVHFTETELRYLQVFFISLQNNTPISFDERDKLDNIVYSLIQHWQHQLPYDLSLDKELYDSVSNHLSPAIPRFKHAIPIENPLIDDIKSIYMNTFNIVKKSMHIIEDEYNCQLSDEEIGFFALHLAAAIDRQKESLKTLLVSHSGSGATYLLINKLKDFSEIEIVDMVSYISVSEHSLENIDLIISTSDMKIVSDIPVIVINTLLYDYDIIRLKSIVRKHYKNKNNPNK